MKRRMKHKRSSKKRNSFLIIGIVGIIILAGAIVLHSGNSDETSSEIKLPSYAYTNPLTLKAYRYATEHPDILEQIPCYCGCGGHSGHRFLRDCYIHDDWTYDDHASFCDICIGEVIKLQEYLAKGISLKEARAKIDAEYSKYGTGTNTPPVSNNYIPILSPKSEITPTPKPDLSRYSLPENFNSLGDGLNLTPAGAIRAYFINNKLLIGTQLEEYVIAMSRGDDFYGKKIVGMYSADFSPSSWIELHDLGYDSTKDTTIMPRSEQGMKNIVYTRPLIYGHTQNVDNVLKLMRDPKSMPTSYDIYKPLLDAVDYENTGVALVTLQKNNFSDMNYWSITPVDGGAELVIAYNITDYNAIPSGFDKYNPVVKGNVMIIRITGDVAKVHVDKEYIDAIAR